MAELTAPSDDRPFPPGDYPVLVIGSGPGGLQVSYSLRRLGIDHAVISADPSPGGMFRRWPFFQRLLSWTKPHAPVERGTRAYERYDWNSLLGDEPGTRALQADRMDGTSYFPSRPEMESNLVAFADAGGVEVRYDCRWTSTRIDEGADGRWFVVETSDGVYRAEALVVAVGVAEPRTPPGIGMEFARHYADVRPAETYAGKCVFIIGKQNSGFELATGLLPWARQLMLSSPSPTQLSVDTRSLVGVRARYVQPYEDHALGGGVLILDASLERIERIEGADGPLAVHVRRTQGGDSLRFEVDEVIAATGFACPVLDLPDLGVTTVGVESHPDPDAVVGELVRPGHLLRRHDRAGGKGAPAPRHAEQFRGGPGRAIQRAARGRADRLDAVRAGDAATLAGPGQPRGLRGDRADRRA